MRYPQGYTNKLIALCDHPTLIYSSLGKIRVKIVTSKDALESLDGKSDVRLLSDKEETQFRDMILGLLVSNTTHVWSRLAWSSRIAKYREQLEKTENTELELIGWRFQTVECKGISCVVSVMLLQFNPRWLLVWEQALLLANPYYEYCLVTLSRNTVT